MKLIRSEPALFVGLVGSIIALVVTFGLKLSADQIGAIMTAVAALMAIVTRTQVTPAATVVAQQVDGQVVAGPASVVADGAPVEVWPVGTPSVESEPGTQITPPPTP